MSGLPTLKNVTERTENSLVGRDTKGYYVDSNDDFIKASKFILKSASTLLQTEAAKLVVPGQGGGLKVIRFKGSSLVNIERQLIKKCFNTRDTFFVEADQMVYNRRGEEIGRAEKPFLVAPLTVDHKTNLGVMLFENQISTGHFTYEDVSLATAFAKTFARLIFSTSVDEKNSDLIVQFTSNLLTLLENLYLYKSNLENNFLLSEMIKVSKMINSTLDLQSLLESIMESGKMVLKAEGSSLMLIDRKTNELYFNIVSGENERGLKEMRIPIGVGIAGIVAEKQKAEIVNDAQSDDRVYKEADAKINFVTRNLIAVPLMVRNRCIGVIEVINSIGREHFSEKDLELFNTFSEQAALAIHNRELIDSLKNINKELKKKVHELSSLHEISKALLSTLNEKDLYDSIVKIVADELQSDKVSIMLYEEAENSLRIISNFGLRLDSPEQYLVSTDTSLSGLSFTENKVIHSNNLGEGPYARYRNEELYETGYCIIHPLGHGEKIYGVINIADKHDETGFTDDDVRLVSTIAGQITKGIENFRLLEEMIEKRAYEKELDITSSIQKSILPNKKLNSPHFDMGVMSMPAKMMGGDFYDYSAFNENEYTFSVADVSGKSLPAALFMAVSSSVLRTIGTEKHDPAEILYKANDLIYADSQSGMFVTLFYTVYNAITRELTFGSAGHNEQFVYRHDSKEIEELHTNGRPLGVIDSELHGKFGQGKTYLRAGDVLILYTDGVIEAINEKGEEFGVEKFKEIIRENHLLTADQMVKRIYREVQDFAGNEPQFDDFTLMVVKVQ